ncbi:hypothetical protein c7_L833 [Megavirus courdo7]|uniref:Uncharacterized protein n=1 Tax=Megavirus courdo7 TaxID=1128135 RepID=H2EBX3_9VIRU|nr:hypothetical protein c7_L833 [Megavirus courdo7]
MNCHKVKNWIIDNNFPLKCINVNENINIFDYVNY